ncbi:MAG: hypothetical protein MK060_12915 [Blastomonas sp.]|uniref:hypothetical protein n=1 Tax=Blastomonas sp. TaxID=1909299 RepID=UPI00406A310C|nr:hypothetical protein [Blastomonas sp.]
MNVEHSRAIIESARKAVAAALNPMIDAEGGDPAAAFLVAGGAVKFLGTVLAYLDEHGLEPTEYRRLMIQMMEETADHIRQQSKATLQ